VIGLVTAGKWLGKDEHGLAKAHSDKEKFCNDLNGPKTLKMSERPLKTLQDFPTSNLNTRGFSTSYATLRYDFGDFALVRLGDSFE
jgi:hypothetical protein